MANVEISIDKPDFLPNDLLIYIKNDSENIIIVKKITLNVWYTPHDQAFYYIRKDDFYADKEEVEPPGESLIFESASSFWAGYFTGIIKAKCTAEYIEVRKRVNSEVYHY